MKVLCVVVIFALLASEVMGSAATCSANDKRYMFSSCDVQSNSMSRIEYYARQCDPETSDPLSLPEVVPCSRTCADGTFYSPRTIGCERCPVGHMSRSDTVFLNNFSSLPPYVATFCTPRPCGLWSAGCGQTVISSSNQSKFQHKTSWGLVDESVESSFVIVVDVTQSSGAIRFSYRVESELSYDGLAVYVDGEVQRNPDRAVSGMSLLWASGLLHQWRTAMIPLTKGRHEVRFTYHKDSNQLSENGQDVGTDRAYLQDIELIGVRSFADHCTPCKAGTFAAVAGSTNCQLCASNTFSDAGAEQCSSCPANEWAPPGSAYCMKKKPCTKDDFVAMYGSCDMTTKARHRLWHLANQRCIPAPETAPKDGPVPCGDCPSGFFRDGAGQCGRCTAGSRYDGAQCRPCPPTTAAIPTLDYSGGFDTFGGKIPAGTFEQDCQGTCASCSNMNADHQTNNDDCFFELAAYPVHDEDNTVVGIRQSPYMGAFYTARLQFPTTLSSDGTIFVKYAFSPVNVRGEYQKPVPEALSAVITIDGFDYPLDKSKTSTTGPHGELKVSASAGSHVVQLTVAQAGAVASDEMYDVILLGLKVVGDIRGGASECETCPSGHYCPGSTDKFVPCEPGHSAFRPGSTECAPCSPGFATKEYGSRNCQYCPWGTQASANGKLCENLCNVTYYGHHFDLTPFREQILGPVTTNNVDTTGKTPEQLDALNVHRFYVSPCTFANKDKQQDTCTKFFGDAVEDAFVCQRLNGNWSYSLGDDVRYGVVGGRLVQFITGGDRCHHQTTAPRSSNITYVCDPDAVPGTLTFVNEAPACQYNFVINSRYGCPICTERSYQTITSECGADELQHVQHFKRAGHENCLGGYAPPPNANITCRKCKTTDYEVLYSDCVSGVQLPTFKLHTAAKGCIDDGKLNLTTTYMKRACSKIDASFGANMFTVGLTFLIGGILMTSAALYFLYIRHRDLEVRYERLSTNQNMEMADCDDDDDDDANEFSGAAVVEAEASKTARAAVAAINHTNHTNHTNHVSTTTRREDVIVSVRNGTDASPRAPSPATAAAAAATMSPSSAKQAPRPPPEDHSP